MLRRSAATINSDRESYFSAAQRMYLVRGEEASKKPAEAPLIARYDMAKHESTSDSTPQPGATPGLKTLVKPLAEAIASADQPSTLLAEIFSELVGETIAIEREVFRHLVNRPRRPSHTSNTVHRKE